MLALRVIHVTDPSGVNRFQYRAMPFAPPPIAVNIFQPPRYPSNVRRPTHRRISRFPYVDTLNHRQPYVCLSHAAEHGFSVASIVVVPFIVSFPHRLTKKANQCIHGTAFSRP